MNSNTDMQDRFRGMILGTAVGDSVGLPAEGMSRKRNAKFNKGRWRHRLVLGRGMVSDDTEHTCFTSQSLIAHSGSPQRFIRRMGWSLRFWFLGLPAGIGLGTARAIIKLLVGFPPTKSGIFTAGNGPAMRIAPIGAFFDSDDEALTTFTGLCTNITHTDPKALTGALAVARLAAWIVCDAIRERPAAGPFIELLRRCGEDDDWADLVGKIESAITDDISVDDFVEQLGLSKGVSGYIYHTVPVVLYAWHHHCGDFEATLSAVLNCGGDTDTTGAIIGALAGLTVGESGIPKDWIDGIIEWPRNVRVMREIADRLAAVKAGEPQQTVNYFWPVMPLRNLFFLTIVLVHGFRRLLPPY